MQGDVSAILVHLFALVIFQVLLKGDSNPYPEYSGLHVNVLSNGCLRKLADPKGK